MFDFGIDNVGSDIKFLYDLRLATGKDASALNKPMEWDGLEYSYDELIDYIESNDLEEKLANAVKEKWKAIDESISSAHRKKKYPTKKVKET